MSLPDRQRQLVERLLLIEDAHERLSALTARGRRWPAPAPEEKTEANRVAGCASAVWLVGSIEAGRCRFRVAAESGLVLGLAALLCELYDDHAPGEIVAFDATVVSELGFDRQLSPTRLNGLANIQRVIRDFASRALRTG